MSNVDKFRDTLNAELWDADLQPRVDQQGGGVDIYVGKVLTCRRRESVTVIDCVNDPEAMAKEVSERIKRDFIRELSSIIDSIQKTL